MRGEPMSTERHWTEDAPVRLASSRVKRVYIAGPMTGLPEFNFPAFNAEAAKLREAGMAVLNPADHGIVDGADWADYLRHDIAGLSSCESIFLLPGWSNSKGARLERTIADALGMRITFHPDAERDAAQAEIARLRDENTALNERLEAQPQGAGEAVAWRYEIATHFEGDLRGQDWRWRMTDYTPNVPDGLIRNLRPLAYADITPPAAPAVPDGWRLASYKRGGIEVHSPDGASVYVEQIAYAARLMPEEVLYALCRALLAYTPEVAKESEAE